MSKRRGRAGTNRWKWRWAVNDAMDPCFGDGSFGALPYFHHPFKLSPPRIEPRTLGVAIPIFRSSTRPLNRAVGFARQGSVSKGTSMSVPIESGCKRELSLVVGNYVSFFETRGSSIPTFAGWSIPIPAIPARGPRRRPAPDQHHNHSHA